jgi:hypothetical protein
MSNYLHLMEARRREEEEDAAFIAALKKPAIEALDEPDIEDACRE